MMGFELPVKRGRVRSMRLLWGVHPLHCSVAQGNPVMSGAAGYQEAAQFMWQVLHHLTGGRPGSVWLCFLGAMPAVVQLRQPCGSTPGGSQAAISGEHSSSSIDAAAAALPSRMSPGQLAARAMQRHSQRATRQGCLAGGSTTCSGGLGCCGLQHVAW